jgi:two-component system nitrogen regulation response regulator NtrX
LSGEDGVAAERILIVDDEPGVRSALESILGDEGFVVASAESAEAGLALFDERLWDAVLLDVWLPGMDGLEALTRMKERRPDIEVVMISGHGTIDTAVRATKLGAFDFVEKPLSLERTLLVLRNALRQRRLERHNRKLLEHLVRQNEILGRSAAAERLRREVAQAARSSAPVLARGELGSGRETVVRGIHAAGEDAGAAFVDVPCAALAPASAAGDLFGDERGPGYLALAVGGTLFLQEVERLEPALQTRLAAELAAARGSIRLLATCGPGGQGVEPALASPPGVIVIDVPPLRQRREDVPLLAERFMAELAREYGVPAKRWTPDCLRALRAHAWPGNVRELHALTERLLLFVTDEVVKLRDLPESMGGARAPAEDLYREFASLDDGVRAFERYYVTRMLAEEKADRRAAARRLGLTLEALERRLERM